MAPSRALRKVCSEQSQRYTATIPKGSNQRPSCRRISAPQSSCRAFSTSITQRAGEPTSADAPANPKLRSENSPSFGFPRPRNPRAINLSSITSNPAYKPPERQPAPKRNQEVSEKTLSHLDALIKKARSNTSVPENASRPKPIALNAEAYASRGRVSRVSDDILDILNKTKADSATRTGLPHEKLTKDLERQQVVLRLGPSLGRSVRLNSGSDLTRAFQTLEGRINGRGNAVRRDERAQKFHVRAGQKKKIQRRARWRAVFKQGYIAELGRVKKMINQGW